MPPKFARLAGLGAFGACAGLLAFYALLVWVTRPPAAGGITPGLAAVTWISLGVVFLALIGAHVAVGKQLLALGRGQAEEA